MARNTKVAADTNAPPITQILAKFVASHPSRGWSDAVDHEAHRTFMNWVGCAIGAARHESAEATLGGVKMLQPAPQSSILGPVGEGGHGERGARERRHLAHVRFRRHAPQDHHPSGRPVASALLALAEVTGASGREVIDALVLGIDVSCRLGNCIYPEHYDRGWHITGSTGRSAPRPGARASSSSTRSTRRGRSASRPRNRSACASSSAR
jgi:hypothetical protein